MPTKRQRQRQPRKQKKQPRRRPRRRNRNNRANALTPYAAMIADPCNCTLIPGLHGTSEGLLARVKKTLFNATADTCGYVLWVPDYSCNFGDFNERGTATNIKCGNLFIWSSTEPDQQPYNERVDVESKMAYGGILSDTFVAASAFSSAFTSTDPAAVLISGDIVQDARTLSACIKMKYTGQLVNASGELAFIQDLPLSSIIYGAGNNEAASVNQLFQQATQTGRFGSDTAEVISRPDETSHVFRNDRSTPFQVSDSNGGITTLSNEGKSQGPNVFGFAWRGLAIPSGQAANLTFEFIKNIEWRPEPVSGLTHATPRVVNTIPKTQSAVKYLDDMSSTWSTKLMSGINQVSKLALSGAWSATKSIVKAGFEQGLKTLPYTAPLLLM
jgi:hypothetical protein